jgi:hypothetical protein
VLDDTIAFADFAAIASTSARPSGDDRRADLRGLPASGPPQDLGRARLVGVDDDPALLDRLALSGYDAQVSARW